ncbi:MAG: hypothetical protein WKF87_08520 [Chryseolinea sp.]
MFTLIKIGAPHLLVLFLFVTVMNGQSQNSPVDHMNLLSKREEMLSGNYMSYMSEVAHGGRARKMEKKRSEVIQAVRESIYEAGKMGAYKGDASLRDAYKQYWTVLLNIFNEEYHKVVDMEEVAEQSYDAMEAYLLIQEKAGDKLEGAYEKVTESYKAFALNHQVRLLEAQQTTLSKKLGQTGSVNQYYNTVYLVFFKSYVQEEAMLKALNANDLNGTEQGRGSMLKFAIDGLERLDTMKAFQGDGSVISACRNALTFYKSEAEQFSAITGFLISKEEFDKTKKSFDSKPASKRTQKDVDEYNRLLKEYNNSINSYNKANSALNTSRTKVLDNWEKARKKFFDVHVPHK